MGKPNLFLIGAPKAGTTIMSEYLRQHPEIYFSSPKELHYFSGSEFPQVNRSNMTISRYLNYFSAADNRHKYIAEGSVWYLYSESAISRIFAFDSEAKIIVMLRRPDQMVYAQHSTGVRCSLEPEDVFADAWAKSKERNSELVGGNTLLPELKIRNYQAIAKYSEQLERVYSIFSKEQVLVILYEDFQTNNRKQFNIICEFLDIRKPDSFDIQYANQNVRVRSKLVAHVFNHIPVWVSNLLINAKRLLGIKKRIGLRKLVVTANTTVERRAEMDESLRREIIQNYREDIGKLEKLIDRDLSDWLK